MKNEKTIYLPNLSLFSKYFFLLLQEDQDWGIVAMVLDRLFLWTFGTVALVGSLIILSDSPFIYDSIVPIDVKYSKIAEIEEKMYQRALS